MQVAVPLRLAAGIGIGTRAAGEVWLSGALTSAPMARPGDEALYGGGLGGRLRIGDIGESGKLSIWARGGLGYGVFGADVGHGPMGFAGGLLVYQPMMKRFSLAFELDVLGNRGGLGWALLPSLRCAL